MTKKIIKSSDVLGDNYYIYELSSSNYTPALNGTITITCTVTDVYGDPIGSKSITLYKNGTSVSTKTTNSSGVATWSVTCSNAGIQSFKVGKKTIEVFVDNKSDTGHTHTTTDITNLSIPSASNTTPSADTTSGSVGTGTTWARSNHTHPKSSLYAEADHTHSQYLTSHQSLDSKTVTVEKLATATSGYLSSYVIKQNGVQVGNTIDIPKDFLVKSGSVKTVNTANNPVTGYSVGDKYIDLIINTKDSSGTDEHIYILVSDLVTSSIAISDVTNLQTTLNNKIDTAGTGLSKNGTTLNHSNSITAVTTAAFKKIKYDAQGHITGTANVSASDLPSHTHSYANSSHEHSTLDITSDIEPDPSVQDIAYFDEYASHAMQDAGLSLQDNLNDYITYVNIALNHKSNNEHTHSQYLTEHQDLSSYVTTNDSRLSDARTPTSHTHGNLTNDGKVGSTANYFVYTTTNGAITSKQKIGNITTSGAIGSTANLPVITTTSGVLTTGSFGTTANTFCQGNDSRLSDARTPTAHTHSSLDIGSPARSWSNFNDYLPDENTQDDINIAIDDILTLKEDKGNKVTSLSSSNTDTQYPSAKSVYDYINNKLTWKKLTLTNMSGFTLYYNDYFCHLKMERTGTLPTAGSYTALVNGTIPEGYRPPVMTTIPTDGTSTIRVKVTAGGAIQYYTENAVTSSATIRGTWTWARNLPS